MKGLNGPWVRRMLRAGADSLVEVRNRALVAVGYDTLLLRSELMALRLEDRIIDRLIAKRSLGLCWNAGLHPRDALHVAVALEEGCDVLETRDGKLLRNNGLDGTDHPRTVPGSSDRNGGR